MSSEKSLENGSSGQDNPFSGFDGRKGSTIADQQVVTVLDLEDADEALGFLENHPRAVQIAEEGAAILDDPKLTRKLLWKIDLTITPLLAAVYFLQFLDKTTLSYTAVMGIRTETHLVGQDYSNLSMLFYIGTLEMQTKTSHRAVSMLTMNCQASLPRSFQPNTSHSTLRV